MTKTHNAAVYKRRSEKWSTPEIAVGVRANWLTTIGICISISTSRLRVWS